MRRTALDLQKGSFVALIILAALLLGLLSAQPAQAHGTAWPNAGGKYPYHQQRYAGCDNYNNRVLAYTPNNMLSYYASWERVSWGTTLYKYSNGAWRQYRYFTYNELATASRQGLEQTYVYGFNTYWYHHWPTAAVGVNSQNYNNLPPGTYAVKQYFDWSAKSYSAHQQWQPFPNGTTKCRIT